MALLFVVHPSSPGGACPHSAGTAHGAPPPSYVPTSVGQTRSDTADGAHVLFVASLLHLVWVRPSGRSVAPSAPHDAGHRHPRP